MGANRGQNTKAHQGQEEPEETRRIAEETALGSTTRRLSEENARLEASVQAVQSRSALLEALISEQEDYLAQVQAMIADLEQRRRDWQQRYTELTGQPL